ncbi:TPA: hypothetical protein I7783_19030 [Vibrio vulnificus]|nr:hypothetical protein CRN42_13095 [Vibrio vulnificus]HAS8600089.1 hypothetical protein [Vibrio vulnificus]
MSNSLFFMRNFSMLGWLGGSQTAAERMQYILFVTPLEMSGWLNYLANLAFRQSPIIQLVY